MKLVPWRSGGFLRPVDSLQNEVNRLFEDFFGRDIGLQPFRGRGEWMPVLDVAETDDAVVVKAEMPGLERDDVKLSLTDDILTITGEKKAETEEKKKNFHRVERSYGSFERTIRLPSRVQANKVEAKFKNGVLTVELPKAEESKTKSVDIKVE